MLLKNGPIKLTSCIRFEAKHKVLKAVANAIPCRINIGHTLANKLQLQTVSRLLSKTGVHEDLKLGIDKELLILNSLPCYFTIFHMNLIQFVIMLLGLNLKECTIKKEYL